MTENALTYILLEPMGLAPLLSGLSERYFVHEDAVMVETICYLDTFDWRLYDKGLICRRHGNNIYTLTDFLGEYQIEEQGPAPKKLFSQDFAGGALGEKLIAVAGIRALLPLAEIRQESQSFQIMNRDQKKVLSGSLESNYVLISHEGHTAQPAFLGGALRLRGVRGYDKIFIKVAELMQSQGLEPGYSEERVLRLTLAAQRKKPQDYCSQFSVILDPAETNVHAAQKIFMHLLQGMQRNVPGVIEDIDTEFLHDFRVALRRTRSLLGSMKKVMLPADIAHFQQGFKKIGTFTGPVRDLDVYLLGKNAYQSMLPGGLQEGLAVFFHGLARQRARELQRLRKALHSSYFQDFMTQWQEYVDNTLLPSALAAGQEPCKEVAIKAIKKRLRSILRSGELIGPQSPDTELHSLRIQAKKLRYLLEFYRSLFPVTEMDILLKSLKRLQDNLGSFNDLSVQQKMLGQYQDELAGKDQKNAIKVAAALGGLITHLHEEQTAVRYKFEQTFEQFTTSENRRLFDLLFQ